MIPEIKVWIFYDISSNLSGKIPYNSTAYQSTNSWHKAREAAKVVSLTSKIRLDFCLQAKAFALK